MIFRFGIYTVFLQCLNYIIGKSWLYRAMVGMESANRSPDSYLMFAASAIAANTIMRSLFGAIFPLFAVSIA